MSAPEHSTRPWHTWLRNRRFRFRQFAARHPRLFFSVYRLSPINRTLMVRRATRITIEGYPRSANTYAVYAFRHANPDVAWDEIGHHLHVQAQVTRSVEYGIPVVVLVRHPFEAIRSLLVRHDFIRPAEAVADYLRFYRDLYPLRDAFVVAMFEDATRDMGGVIRRLNRRFATRFEPFDDEDPDARRAVMDEIDRRNQRMDRGRVTHLYRPDREKDALKAAVTLDTDSRQYSEALAIYERYRALARD